jgi:hypothetical protein
MPADAPAPSALDALLAEVDDQLSIERSSAYGISYAERLSARYRLGCVDAPRLAAIVRVLREACAFYEMGRRNAFRCANESLDPEKGTGPCCERVIDAGGIAQAALARAEAIARGEES